MYRIKVSIIVFQTMGASSILAVHLHAFIEMGKERQVYFVFRLMTSILFGSKMAVWRNG